MTHRTPTATQTADPTPARLRKLMLRLARLTPGTVYAVTLFLADEHSEPAWTVQRLGELENYCASRKNVLS